MLRLNRLAFLLLASCCYTFSIAQSSSCSADFNYSVAPNSSLVYFFAKDSLGTNHRWLFGDGASITVAANGMATHEYEKPGKYEVKHFMEKPGTNCHDSIVKIITVEWVEQCNALFSYQKNYGTLSYQFYNNASATSQIKKTFWDFGDGTTSDVSSPLHTFSKPGKYNVCLQIETSAGCSSKYCDELEVIDSIGNCVLAPKFQYRKDGANCTIIYFTNASTPAGNDAHFTWNFGDGTSSHDLSPRHEYAKPGKYYVCLVEEVGANCRKEYCDSVIAICDTVCNTTARFEWKRDSADCKKIRFINYSAPVTANMHFAWKFGDGDGSNDANPVHTYSKEGRYAVCLVVTTANNCTNYYCDSVTVVCTTQCNVKPSFSWKASDSNPAKVYFTNLTADSVQGTHYTWSFGDKSFSHDVNASHLYAQPGKYNVCLVAESTGCRKETCQQIEIKTCNVIARFEKQHNTAKWNTVYFDNVSQPVNTIWQTYWSYGDGSTSRDYNSFHEYDKPGVYNVCLKVISLNGCVSEYCDTVRIIKADTCAVNANFSHYASPNSIASTKFEALYQSSSAVYAWGFGDSTGATGRIVYHAYSKPGKYNVCLTVKDGQCITTRCETITIEQTPNGGRIAVFPNPAVSSVSIEVKLDVPGQLSISFVDGSGAARSSFKRNGVSGTNRYTLPVQQLSNGLYMVEIKSSTGVWYTRFVKG